jgi:hypothetical protein
VDKKRETDRRGATALGPHRRKYYQTKDNAPLPSVNIHATEFHFTASPNDISQKKYNREVTEEIQGITEPPRRGERQESNFFLASLCLGGFNSLF